MVTSTFSRSLRDVAPARNGTSHSSSVASKCVFDVSGHASPWWCRKNPIRCRNAVADPLPSTAMFVARTRSSKASVVSVPGVGCRSRSSMRMLPTLRTTLCTRSSRDLSHNKYDSSSTSSPRTVAMNSISTAAPRRRRDVDRCASMSAATTNFSRAMGSFESIVTPPPPRITN
ncbi:unannotated protein [freshwater metagenome]|uniref:Unannotated protein n=1 Tax=freshwater metagenome TaxID=449393 RepID=A0A6J6AG90_9ZZZZ